MRKLAITAAATLLATAALAQNTMNTSLTLPTSGNNQRASVTQYIGPVKVTIDYSSPDVHAPNGEDRRGKIYGTDVVHWGWKNLGFGTCTACPWRAGSNENTVFTTSHDIQIEGQKLPAGTYGLFMVADPANWTVIFSKNSTSWGSYFYKPEEDALRVNVKPAGSEYNEWLTYEFIDRQPSSAVVAMKWEDVQVPVKITVPDIVDAYLTEIRKELRSSPGFRWQNWNNAAQYALQNKRFDDALEFAQVAAKANSFGSDENFQTLSTLAEAQEAKGMTAEARVTRNKALNHPTASVRQLHQYARTELGKGNKSEAIRIWQLNAKRYPNQWPVNVGLMRAASAAGKYRDALRYAKRALAQAPDDLQKESIEASIKKLEAGQDANS
ncbi:MAG TPA: DUF2911 domain-containing protein [Thermoanaerobaculia bacterium]|nr:DUF2911 domain-containing protein [Thermoanaerobaculia bacterium]